MFHSRCISAGGCCLSARLCSISPLALEGMLIPYRSDAPVYRWPIGTIACLVINALVFLLVDERTTVQYLVLRYDGLDPVGWFTSAFAHADWIHLIGNLTFLWCFGLIVEGRVGWLRFTGIYATALVVGGLVEQILMMGGPGGSLGASGVIYSLMVIAAIWSPRSEIDSVFLMGIYTRSVTTRVSSFAILFVGWDVLWAAIGGFGLSTALLQSWRHRRPANCRSCCAWSGLIAKVGTCSRYEQERPKPRVPVSDRTTCAMPVNAMATTTAGYGTPNEQAGDVLGDVRSLLANGSALAAFQAWQRSELRIGRCDLDREVLQRLQWRLAVIPMRQTLPGAGAECHPSTTNLAALERAELALVEGRPRRARSHLTRMINLQPAQRLRAEEIDRMAGQLERRASKSSEHAV